MRQIGSRMFWLWLRMRSNRYCEDDKDPVLRARWTATMKRFKSEKAA